MPTQAQLDLHEKRIKSLEHISLTHAHLGLDNSKSLFLDGVHTYQSSLTAITQNNWVALAFQVNSFDKQFLHDVTTNNTRITFNRAGLFIIGGQFMPNGFTASALAAKLQVNGSTVIAQNVVTGSVIGAISNESMQITAIYNAVPGDYVEIYAAHNVGGTVNTTGDSNNFFWATKVSN